MEVEDSSFAEPNNVQLDIQETLAILKKCTSGLSFITSKCGYDTEKENDTPDAESSKCQHQCQCEDNSDLDALQAGGYKVMPDVIENEHDTFDMGNQVSVRNSWRNCNIELH